MGIRQSELLVNSEFTTDKDGNPTGGETWLEIRSTDDLVAAMHIFWQDGIVGDNGQTGAFIEDVLEAVRQRLQFFQTSRFRCKENAMALNKVEEALQALDWRTRKRLLANVENTYEAHSE